MAEGGSVQTWQRRPLCRALPKNKYPPNQQRQTPPKGDSEELYMEEYGVQRVKICFIRNVFSSNSKLSKPHFNMLLVITSFSTHHPLLSLPLWVTSWMSTLPFFLPLVKCIIYYGIYMWRKYSEERTLVPLFIIISEKTNAIVQMTTGQQVINLEKHTISKNKN